MSILSNCIYVTLIAHAVLISCDGFDSHQGKVGVSFSLMDSKKRGVFIREISFMPEVINNDSTILVIKDCWLEHKWRFGKNHNLTQKGSGQQIVIEFQPSEFTENYMIKWIIITESDPSVSLGKVGTNSAYYMDPDMSNLSFLILEGRKKVHDTTELTQRYLGRFALIP